MQYCNHSGESGVSILSGVEDVQQMLDDHILKAQTMHRLVDSVDSRDSALIFLASTETILVIG